MKIKNQWKAGVLTAAALCVGLCFSACTQGADDATVNELNKLKTKYVNPLQFDAKNVGGIAVLQKNAANGARFAESEELVNLVLIKDDGKSESAVVLGTEENADKTEAPKEEAEKNEYNYKYVTPENNTIANVLETKQCPYELNDSEAGGYYIVFDGKSTFTYNDETEKEIGSLIYVTPSGDERDVFGKAGIINAKIQLWQASHNGTPYMEFDENGNAFFMAEIYGVNKLFRYQPIADKLDDLTPKGIEDLNFDNICVSLDGKYICVSCFTYDVNANIVKERAVKVIKVADKSIKDIYTSKIPGQYWSASNIVYLDKNHSFYFATSSWDDKETEKDPNKKYDNIENYINKWSFADGKITFEQAQYKSDSKYYNNEVGDPTEGSGKLILTSEGIFVMQPTSWKWEDEAFINGHWEASRLIKAVAANGDFIRCEIPASLKDKNFAPPRYNEKFDESKIDDKNPATWYTPSFLTNGKGVAVIGNISKQQNTIYYYADGQLKNLLAFDTDQQLINKMTLSDKSIIFNATKKGSPLTKSINLDDGEVTLISINGTVLNMLAVSGKKISSASVTDVKVKCSVTISAQNDVKIEQKLENGKLTLTASTGFDSYVWTCNNVVIGEGAKFEKTVTSWAPGYYPIYLVAKKGLTNYSSFVEVEIK